MGGGRLRCCSDLKLQSVFAGLTSVLANLGIHNAEDVVKVPSNASKASVHSEPAA